VALLPLHPPEAVQAVALVEFQVRVEKAPLETATGSAESVSVGVLGDSLLSPELPELPHPEETTAAANAAINVRIYCVLYHRA